jgi:6-phosphofructokinase 1
VVVAEGVDPPEGYEPLIMKKDAFGFDRLGGVAFQIADAIEDLTQFETRVSVLGHIQRGGTPVAADRVLATRLGVAALNFAEEGMSNVMAAVSGNAIVPVPMKVATESIRGVPQDIYDTAAVFFG